MEITLLPWSALKMIPCHAENRTVILTWKKTNFGRKKNDGKWPLDPQSVAVSVIGK